MKQMTFSDVEYSGRKKVTQKEKFLSMMEQIIPWAEWIGKIQPYYPSGKRGRPPRGIEVMLRIPKRTDSMYRSVSGELVAY